MRWAALVVASCSLCSCTQDFGKFDPVADGSSGTDGSDASASDAPADTFTCNVSSTCISSASVCGQSCGASYTTCTQGCGQSQSCKAQCKNTEQSCKQNCVSTCVTCSALGTCAQTPCQSAVP